MSSRPSRGLARAFPLRIALWYAGLFVLSAVAVAVVTYVLLARALAAQDHSVLESMLSRYASEYERSGLAGLRTLIEADAGEGRHERLLVRVIGRQTEVVYFAEPPGWDRFDLSKLDDPTAWQAGWTTLDHPPDGSVLDVSIPAGTREGQTLRLRRKGARGLNGGTPGDALVEVEIRPHPVFTRKGEDIHVELQLPLADAVLGGKISVPTIDGTVTMTVPKWSNSGRTLRLKGKGIKRADAAPGDEYVTLKIMLPEKPDAELERLVAEWQQGTGAAHHGTEA